MPEKHIADTGFVNASTLHDKKTLRNGIPLTRGVIPDPDPESPQVWQPIRGRSRLEGRDDKLIFQDEALKISSEHES